MRSAILTDYKIKYKAINDICYPEFVRFFANVRLLVKKRHKSFAEFSRAIRASNDVKLSYQTLRAYEVGYFNTIQYNYLVSIASFFGESVHDMLQIDFSTRDTEPV